MIVRFLRASLLPPGEYFIRKYRLATVDAGPEMQMRIVPILLKLSRSAGLAGIIGGIALAAAYLTHPASAPPETVASAAWIWIHVGFLVSLISGIFLLMGLLAVYLRKGGGISGFVGFALAIVSLVLVAGLDYSEIFIFPTLALEFPEVVVRYGDGTSMPSVAFAFPITGIVFLIGFVLFGWQLYATSAVERPAAVVMILGTVVFAIGLSGLLPMLVVRIGSVIFGAGLTMLGMSLWRQPP